MATISDQILLPSIAGPAYQYNCCLQQSEYVDDLIYAITFPLAATSFFRVSVIFNSGVAENAETQFFNKKGYIKL
jgi:hypothetical protein